jgi:hypothetical protein
MWSFLSIFWGWRMDVHVQYEMLGVIPLEASEKKKGEISHIRSTGAYQRSRRISRFSITMYLWVNPSTTCHTAKPAQSKEIIQLVARMPQKPALSTGSYF